MNGSETVWFGLMHLSGSSGGSIGLASAGCKITWVLYELPLYPVVLNEERFHPARVLLRLRNDVEKLTSVVIAAVFSLIGCRLTYSEVNQCLFSN